jgi:hypothetical protein
MKLKTKRTHKGGKVLGAGQDGCVFSQDAWPCETDLAGYDPSDPTVVSKIVKRTDNEDEVIDIAKEILKDSRQHIVQKIGTCVPEKYDDSRTDSIKLKQMLDNKAEIDTIASSGDYNACTELSDNVEEDDLKKYFKSIINKRYTNDLYHYILKHSDDKDICIKILNAVPSFASALHKLAKNPRQKLINMDLHGLNIFVEEAVNKSIILGMADFGRCAVTKSRLNDLTNEVYKYVTETDVAYSFSCFSIHTRLFSFFASSPTLYNSNTIIDQYCYSPKFVKDVSNEMDIIYLLEKYEANNFIKKYLSIFTSHFNKVLVKQDNNSEIDAFIYYVFGETFHTIGFLNVIINTLMNTREVLNEYPALRTAIREYVVNNNASKFSNTLLHRLVKFYFDLLMYPYKMNDENNAVDMMKLLDIMKNYNFISDLDKVFKGQETVAGALAAAAPVAAPRVAPRVATPAAAPTPVVPRTPARTPAVAAPAPVPVALSTVTLRSNSKKSSKPLIQSFKNLRERLQRNTQVRANARAAEIRAKKKTRKNRR